MTRRNTGFKSARERIEETPDIAETEMHWVKSGAGELVESVLGRRRRSAMVGTFAPTDRMSVHTHIAESDQGEPFTTRNKAFPSSGDLDVFARQVSTTNIRTFTVVSVDEDGKVMGYAGVRANRKFVDECVRNNGRVVIPSKISGLVNKRLSIALLQHFLANGYLRLKTFPMQGYRFDKKWNIFVKK